MLIKSVNLPDPPLYQIPVNSFFIEFFWYTDQDLNVINVCIFMNMVMNLERVQKKRGTIFK